MSAIASNLTVVALGWALLHFIWQGLIVGASTGVLLMRLRDASPRWRYAVCALALLICLALPLIQLVYFLGQASALPEQGQTIALPDWWYALQAHIPALMVAWGLGVSVMTLRLSLGLVWVSKQRHSSIPAPAIWQDRLDELARRMGLHYPVPLKLHMALSSPVTLGFWRPVVLLPAALLSGMPVSMLEALLAHELAHVRRWDYLINLLQSLVESLLFFHPVVWWLSTRMRIEREQVADELAAQALKDPRRLALALHALSLQVAQTAQPVLAMSARGGILLRRIERLMAPPPTTASWKLALPALLVACTSLLVQAQGQSSGVKATDIPAEPAYNLQQLAVNAKHVLVLDEAGRVLMKKDADTVVPIASLTKLMTAMVLLDAKLDPNEKLRITRADMRIRTQANSLLTLGSEFPRAAALKLTLMASENRAAALLARTYPGGPGAFGRAMQAKVQSLGLTRTTMTDATGISLSNMSTATEIAKIAAAAAGYPEIASITSGQHSMVTLNGLTRELHNTNPLVGGVGWDIRLSKTGTSNEAGRCLAMRMRSGSRNVTVVLLDADNSEQRLRDASNIRDSLVRLSAQPI